MLNIIKAFEIANKTVAQGLRKGDTSKSILENVIVTVRKEAPEVLDTEIFDLIRLTRLVLANTYDVDSSTASILTCNELRKSYDKES